MSCNVRRDTWFCLAPDLEKFHQDKRLCLKHFKERHPRKADIAATHRHAFLAKERSMIIMGGYCQK
eukprot:5445656-Prorocentrum_lima.AAC.1